MLVLRRRHSFGESKKNQKDFGGWRNSNDKCALRDVFLWKSEKEHGLINLSEG
jgi:hypothetical protein